MTSVRLGTRKDQGAVFILAREFATSFSVEEDRFCEAFAQILSSSDMYFAVAQSSNRTIGYVLGTAHPTFYAGGPVAWVEEIMVEQASRRKGTGRLLMENFEIWAKAKNCRLMALATRRAAAFYKSFGYVESATYFRKVLPNLP